MPSEETTSPRNYFPNLVFDQVGLLLVTPLRICTFASESPVRVRKVWPAYILLHACPVYIVCQLYQIYFFIVAL